MGKKEFYLYRERTLSDKLNDTFGFIRDNWQVMLKFSVYLLLPLCMVAAVFTNSFMDGSLAELTGESNIWQNPVVASLSYLLSGVCSVVLAALLFALVQLYMKRANGLEDLTFQELRDPLINNVGKIIVQAILFFVVFVILIFGLVILESIIFLLLNVGGSVVFLLAMVSILGIMVLLLPLQMVVPTYLLEENIGVFDSFKKGYRLGWHTWGSLFLLTLVFVIISSLLSMLFVMPRFAVYFYDIFMAEKQGGGYANPSMLVSFGHYLLTVIYLFGSSVVSVVMWLGIIFHYGHAAEKVDGMATDQAIEDFEEL